MTSKKWLGVGLLSALGYMVLAPFWSLFAIYRAASNNNTTGLNQYIDFVNVRAVLTQQLAGNDGGWFGDFLEGATGAAVEQWLTPERLVTLLSSSGDSEPASDRDYTDFINSLINRTTIHYSSLNRFGITINHPGYGHVGLVMERAGLIYLLTIIDIKGEYL